MKKILITIPILFIVSFLFAQTTTINYSPSSADMPNPERGFYSYSITYASNYNVLNANYLASKRTPFTPSGANYQVHSTLIFRYFVLDDFISSPITNSFLTNLQTDFDVARQAGVKLIVRFTYTNNPPTGNCGSWICPPYGDASKEQVLQHIQQLKPYLQANGDVIATLQMGFIGVWGENYYTDFFGDASQSPYIITNSNWTDRSEVLDSLLRAVPSNRTVQVRYPQIKQKYIYGNSAPTNSASLTLAEAYNETDKARIGFHNDCFLASATDFGTYSDYGPPVSMDDTTNLKPYLEFDTQFVPNGGETCSLNNPDDNCASVGGMADSELARFHYSYLNCQFNNNVNNDWTGVCMEDIKRNLGYRFSLINGTYPNSSNAGSSINVTINIENEGYVAPFNPRGIELVLREVSSGATYFAPLNVDPRYWSTGTYNINENICIPENMPTGNYELLLNLPDPEPTLFDNPLYSIQLANTNVWESATGFNHLNHTIQITNSNNVASCFGGQMFTSTSIYDPTYCQSVLNLSNQLLTDIYGAENKVISNGTVSPIEYIIFHAGDEIELLPGFEVIQGSTFWALIEDCF